MASPTMRQIIQDTKNLVAQKTAQAKGSKAAEITGQAPSSMPGAEHDSMVPDAAKQPSKETRDGTMVPNSGLSPEGAGDDSQITRGHALEADEAALSPKEKPAITADANAKTAGDSATLGNEILMAIRGVQKAAQAPAAPAPAAAKVAAAPAAAPAPAKAAAVAPAASADAAPQKSAHGELNMECTTDIMAKLAAMMLCTDEGAKLARDVMHKAAGAEAAQLTMDYLAEQSDLAEKQAAAEQGRVDAQRAIQEQIFMAGVKYAQDMMAGGGGDMAGLGAMMPGAEGADPAAAGGLPPEAGAEAGAGDMSEDQILQLLQQAIESGEITPEEIQALLAEGGGEAGAAGGDAGLEALAGGEAGGAAAGGEPPAAAPEAAPEPEEAGEPEEKSSAANLLAAIRQLKQAAK